MENIGIDINKYQKSKILSHLSSHKNHSSRTKNIPFQFDDITFNPVRGEMALWVAVITQAMMDALSRSSNKEAQYHKHEAMRWLTENSRDFIEVCLCAGMNPDEVRRKAKRAIASPSLWRAEAGTGARYQERKQYRMKVKLMARKQQTLTPRIFAPVAMISAAALSERVIAGPWS